MKQEVPRSPFATRLSGSAKETELRLRNIFQWKKKRPPVILLLAAILLAAGCGSLVHFNHAADPEPAQSQISMDGQEGQETGPALTMECLSEIGKTFDLIREENPDIDYQSIVIPNASGQCLGQAQGQFLYYFFGVQDFPSLSDVGAEYGDQLRCAGIVSTIGEVYPEAAEELPLEQFFADQNISDYTYYLDDGPGQGWIEFSQNGYLVWVNTNDSGASSDDSAKAATMKRSYTVIIIDAEILYDNYSIQDKYRNDYLESLDQAWLEIVKPQHEEMERLRNFALNPDIDTSQPRWFSRAELEAVGYQLSEGLDGVTGYEMKNAPSSMEELLNQAYNQFEPELAEQICNCARWGDSLCFFAEGKMWHRDRFGTVWFQYDWDTFSVVSSGEDFVIYTLRGYSNANNIGSTPDRKTWMFTLQLDDIGGGVKLWRYADSGTEVASEPAAQ